MRPRGLVSGRPDYGEPAHYKDIDEPASAGSPLLDWSERPPARFEGRPVAQLGGTASVVVVEADPDIREHLCKCLPPHWAPQEFGSLDEADGAHIQAGKPAILLLGPSQATEPSLERAATALQSTPGTGAVLVVESVSPALMRQALRSGLDDALSLASVAEQLPGALEDLVQRLESALTWPGKTEPRGTGRGAKVGFVTSVFSPKGGVGKSVVAVNLAAALSQRTGEPAVIVDLDLQFGDVAVMLRLQPRHTFADAVSAGELLDEPLLRSFLARHEKSGVWVLAAPTSPSDADMASPAGMLRVLELLRAMFPHVVVDTPPHLSEMVLQAVAASDAVAFVVGMEVPSVKSAHLGLQAFDLLQVRRSKVVLVLNRADSKVHVTAQDIEKALEARFDVGFPSEITVPQSVNQGQPAIVAYPRSRFSAQAFQLADLVLARADEAQRRAPAL